MCSDGDCGCCGGEDEAVGRVLAGGWHAKRADCRIVPPSNYYIFAFVKTVLKVSHGLI